MTTISYNVQYTGFKKIKLISASIPVVLIYKYTSDLPRGLFFKISGPYFWEFE